MKQFCVGVSETCRLIFQCYLFVSVRFMDKHCVTLLNCRPTVVLVRLDKKMYLT